MIDTRSEARLRPGGSLEPAPAVQDRPQRGRTHPPATHRDLLQILQLFVGLQEDVDLPQPVWRQVLQKAEAI